MLETRMSMRKRLQAKADQGHKQMPFGKATAYLLILHNPQTRI